MTEIIVKELINNSQNYIEKLADHMRDLLPNSHNEVDLLEENFDDLSDIYYQIFCSLEYGFFKDDIREHMIKKLIPAIIYSEEVNYMRHDMYNQLHNIDSQIAEVIRSQ